MLESYEIFDSSKYIEDIKKQSAISGKDYSDLISELNQIVTQYFQIDNHIDRIGGHKKEYNNLLQDQECLISRYNDLLKTFFYM